jgi:flagellar biogenesis protein FliO
MESDVQSLSWLRFIFASVTVLGLLGLLGWLLKVASLKGWLVPRPSGKADLKCTSSMALDTRRRILVVERDGMEYLLLLGPNNDILLSQSLIPSQSNSSAPSEPT